MALLGENYDKVRELNSDLVALFYTDTELGFSMEPSDISTKMNRYNWTDGWRIQDLNQEIWFGGCWAECEFQTNPNFFVLNTATMRVEVNHLEAYPDVIDAIAEIDNAH